MTEKTIPETDLNATPEERVVALINLTNELSALIAEENALLSDQRPSAIAPLQERKAQLAGAYAVAIREMAANRTDLSGAGEGLLQDLRSMTRRFEQQAQTQSAMLGGTAQAVEGVIKSVAREARPISSAYGNNGRSGQGHRTNTPAPIAIDQRG